MPPEKAIWQAALENEHFARPALNCKNAPPWSCRESNIDSFIEWLAACIACQVFPAFAPSGFSASSMEGDGNLTNELRVPT